VSWLVLSDLAEHDKDAYPGMTVMTALETHAISESVQSLLNDTAEWQRQESLLITRALQKAILSSANFSSIATDAKGVIQIFNVGAEKMLSELGVDKIESTAQSRILVEKLRSLLDEPYVLNYKQEGKTEVTVEHHCTTSIGVVLFNDHEGSQDEILKWADAAMYEAKEAGGNLIRYYDTPAL
jgi:predicted signal transduction protein with EAL and GGDEF domain